ncbi:6835_t:CDS:2 [Entrophospora sp. SA101]|nr:6835_t:CDS:2 [Entrophospora sp. SA101]
MSQSILLGKRRKGSQLANSNGNNYYSDISKCIDLDALFDDIKDNIQEGMPPLKPLQLLELLKAIYE